MNETDDAPQVTLTVSPRTHRRLMLALAVSTVIVYLLVFLLPVSLRRGADPDLSYALDVYMVQPKQEIAQATGPDVDPETEQFAEEQPAAVDEIPQQEQAREDRAAAEPPETIDWYAALEQAAKQFAEQAENPPSMSPEFDQARLVARERYRKSEAPVRKPIWENVEKDQMGRTILRSGDCYRVLDDPSVANQWAQENFTQYILFCGSGKPPPKELPFVADIVARYAYLRPDDVSGYTGIAD